VYFALDPTLRKRYCEITSQVDEWKFTKRKTENVYKLFAMSQPSAIAVAVV